jgi:hypothetical protein
MTCKWSRSMWILVEKGSVRFQIMTSSANGLSTVQRISIGLFLEYDTKEIWVVKFMTNAILTVFLL